MCETQLIKMSISKAIIEYNLSTKKNKQGARKILENLRDFQISKSISMNCSWFCVELFDLNVFIRSSFDVLGWIPDSINGLS